jgi:hypothetical protein
MVPRTFVKVQREIEKIARTLKETKDPAARRALLKEMSLLLKEADRITASLRVAVGGSWVDVRLKPPFLFLQEVVYLCYQHQHFCGVLFHCCLLAELKPEFSLGSLHPASTVMSSLYQPVDRLDPLCQYVQVRQGETGAKRLPIPR